ncbi:conserved exported hypothetical protein [uncultured Dysgonomonas sp.]|uniref:Uncharacterized protein n=1 Tax=uncultured Dysgonomonas sp. TaxID=206096 RepID=A0A212K9H8_9BACT|nr:conserved exported hypothetical protein [uncultured Dysgonomonas sp.]
MKGILTVIIFILILSSVGTILFLIPISLLIVLEPNIASIHDIAWYWYIGLALYFIFALKIIFKLSKGASNWICDLFK